MCCHDYLVTHYLPRILELSTVLTVVYFHRLKINHDSHEFILESGTVGNSYIVTPLITEKSWHYL
jgi:hypothetical protein